MNRHASSFVVVSLVAGVGILTPFTVFAQKKPAAKKPPAASRKATKAGGPVVLGTKQLPGDFGKIGTTYTIGARSPLNFRRAGAACAWHAEVTAGAGVSPVLAVYPGRECRERRSRSLSRA